MHPGHVAQTPALQPPAGGGSRPPRCHRAALSQVALVGGGRFASPGVGACPWIAVSLLQTSECWQRGWSEGPAV